MEQTEANKMYWFHQATRKPTRIPVPAMPTTTGGKPKMGYGQAFAGQGDLYWHIHHTTLAEALTEPLQNRIDFIERNKPKNQVAWRLHSINRVNDDPRWPTTLAALKKAGSSDRLEGIQKEDLEALHAIQCFPNCPWNGKTLFPDQPNY